MMQKYNYSEVAVSKYKVTSKTDVHKWVAVFKFWALKTVAKMVTV